MLKRIMTATAALVCAVVFATQGLAATAKESSLKEITVRGRLQPTVEAGGWVIVSGERKYLLLNAERFKQQRWFREGAGVVAVGQARSGVVSIYMEGTPFEARTLKPAGRGVAVRPVSYDEAAGESPSGGSEGGAVAAQATSQRPASELTRVTVSGEAVVQAQPDTAVLSLAVVTQNASASEAQAENASRTEAVVRAVKAAAGAGAEVKTGGYSLQPQYNYRPNESPQITGYLARNSVVVTMSDLTKVGPTIDAASRASANTVDYLNFTLRRDRPAQAQALAEATRDASAKARTIAETLGGRVVRILEVQEGPIYRPPVPVPIARGNIAGTMAEAVQTPVEPGSLDIRAQVQLVVEVETKP
jgi:hypothetical protein